MFLQSMSKICRSETKLDVHRICVQSTWSSKGRFNLVKQTTRGESGSCRKKMTTWHIDSPLVICFKTWYWNGPFNIKCPPVVSLSVPQLIVYFYDPGMRYHFVDAIKQPAHNNKKSRPPADTYQQRNRVWIDCILTQLNPISCYRHWLIAEPVV